MKRFFLAHPATLIGVFTLCWALVESVGSFTGVSAYEVVWTRYAVHIAFMLIVFGPRKGIGVLRTTQPFREICSSLLMVGMPVCFILAAQRMQMNDLMTVFWTSPLLIVGLTVIFGGHLGGARTIAATLVGMLGAALIYRPDHGMLRLATVLAFGMAACFATYVVLVKSIHQDPVVVKLFHTALWVFVSLSMVVPLVWQVPTARGLLAMILIGLLGWVGLYALDSAIELMSPAILAPVFYTQLAWVALLNWHQYVSAKNDVALLGVVLVAAASAPALAWRSDSETHKREKQA